MVNWYSTILVAVTCLTTLACAGSPAIKPSSLGYRKNPTATNVVLFTDGTNFDQFLSMLMLIKSQNSKLLATYVVGNSWAHPGAAVNMLYDAFHMFGDDSTPVYAGSHYSLFAEQNNTLLGHNPQRDLFAHAVTAGYGGLVFYDTLMGLADQLPSGPRHFNPMNRDPVEDGNTAATSDSSLLALVDLIASLPTGQRVTFLAHDPLTPIAKMFDLPSGQLDLILARLDGIYVMTGAFGVDGNLFPMLAYNNKTEFNAYLDSLALYVVLEKCKLHNIPITIVPLDATNQVPVTLASVEALRDNPKTPEAQLIGLLFDRVITTWFDPTFYFNSAFFWDTCVTSLILSPGLAVAPAPEIECVKVVTDAGVLGFNQGQTLSVPYGTGCATGYYPARIVRNIDGAGVSTLIINTMQSRINSAKYPLWFPK